MSSPRLLVFCYLAAPVFASAQGLGTPCTVKDQDVGEGYSDRDSGIAREHALAIAQVACGMGEVIAFRPVNQAAASWIRKGYSTKGLTIHGKSSDKPLIEGLIPV